jgi:signal peptidase I
MSLGEPVDPDAPLGPRQYALPDASEVEPTGKQRSWQRNAVEWLIVLIGAVTVALVIQATSVQAFYIPSTSMENTLHVDDRVMVNKWSYRLHPIHRGDIVVFTKPKNMGVSSDHNLIKRVIGLPGDKLVFANGHVYVNNKELTEPYVESDRPTEQGPIKCVATAPCVVPAKDVWVMGDNRTGSYDSRYFGPIPESSIVGRAFFRIWPLNRIGSL